MSLLTKILESDSKDFLPLYQGERTIINEQVAEYSPFEGNLSRHRVSAPLLTFAQRCLQRWLKVALHRHRPRSRPGPHARKCPPAPAAAGQQNPLCRLQKAAPARREDRDQGPDQRRGGAARRHSRCLKAAGWHSPLPRWAVERRGGPSHCRNGGRGREPDPGRWPADEHELLSQQPKRLEQVCRKRDRLRP